MEKQSQMAVSSNECLAAAERVSKRLKALATKIDETEDPSSLPDVQLPVDVFLAGMNKRKNAPRVIFKPRMLGNQLWTLSLEAYVYAGIEQAFTKAGLMPGGNRAGHRETLRELRFWVEAQEKNPNLAIPEHFLRRTNRIFVKGVLGERRQERVAVLMGIARHSPTKIEDLERLKNWIDEDLADSRMQKKGRSDGYQKITFAAEIANLWNTLTSEPVTKKPDGNFGQFVVACWKSGFEDLNVNSSFRRTIREHIGEVEDPDPCGRCGNCQNSERCLRKRYFGRLM